MGDGFSKEITGSIHLDDAFTHQLQVEMKPSEIELVAFEDVVGVTVLD
jgi:hypothetical protein